MVPRSGRWGFVLRRITRYGEAQAATSPLLVRRGGEIAAGALPLDVDANEAIAVDVRRRLPAAEPTPDTRMPPPALPFGFRLSAFGLDFNTSPNHASGVSLWVPFAMDIPCSGC